MNRRTLATAAPLIAAALLMTGCIGIRAEKIYSDAPTLGQELTDLKSAHDSGVIDDAEYARLRSRLIEGDDASAGE